MCYKISLLRARFKQSRMSPLIMESHNEYILKVSNLSVKFPNETVLDNISFKLKKAPSLVQSVHLQEFY